MIKINVKIFKSILYHSDLRMFMKKFLILASISASAMLVCSVVPAQAKPIESQIAVSATVDENLSATFLPDGNLNVATNYEQGFMAVSSNSKIIVKNAGEKVISQDELPQTIIVNL